MRKKTVVRFICLELQFRNTHYTFKSCIIFFKSDSSCILYVVYNGWLFDTHNSVISMIFCRPCRFKDTIANEQYMQQLRIMISFSHSSFSIVGLQMISISFCRGRFAILKCHLSQRRQPRRKFVSKKDMAKNNNHHHQILKHFFLNVVTLSR